MKTITPIMQMNKLKMSNIVSRSKKQITNTTQKIANSVKSQVVGASLALATLTPFASSCTEGCVSTSLTNQDYRVLESLTGLNKDESDAVLEVLEDYAENKLGSVNRNCLSYDLDHYTGFRVIYKNNSRSRYWFSANERGFSAVLIKPYLGMTEGYTIDLSRTENNEIEVKLTNVENKQKTVLKTKAIENSGKNEFVGVTNDNVKTYIQPEKFSLQNWKFAEVTPKQSVCPECSNKSEINNVNYSSRIENMDENHQKEDSGAEAVTILGVLAGLIGFFMLVNWAEGDDLSDFFAD